MLAPFPFSLFLAFASSVVAVYVGICAGYGGPLRGPFHATLSWPLPSTLRVLWPTFVGVCAGLGCLLACAPGSFSMLVEACIAALEFPPYRTGCGGLFLVSDERARASCVDEMGCATTADGAPFPVQKERHV